MTTNRKRELKYFCLQYEERKRADASRIGKAAALNAMIEQAAREAAPAISDYILKGATTADTYIHLRTVCGIPCGKNYYYRAMKRFWSLLDTMQYSLY